MRSLDRSIARSPDGLIVRSFDRSIDRSIARWIARSLDRSVASSLDRSCARSCDRSVTRSFDRSLVRSIARLPHRSLDRSVKTSNPDQPVPDPAQSKASLAEARGGRGRRLPVRAIRRAPPREAVSPRLAPGRAERREFVHATGYAGSRPACGHLYECTHGG